MVDGTVLKTVELGSCGFESHPGHQKKGKIMDKEIKEIKKYLKSQGFELVVTETGEDGAQKFDNNGEVWIKVYFQSAKVLIKVVSILDGEETLFMAFCCYNLDDVKRDYERIAETIRKVELSFSTYGLLVNKTFHQTFEFDNDDLRIFIRDEIQDNLTEVLEALIDNLLENSYYTLKQEKVNFSQ